MCLLIRTVSQISVVTHWPLVIVALGPQGTHPNINYKNLKNITISIVCLCLKLILSLKPRGLVNIFPFLSYINECIKDLYFSSSFILSSRQRTDKCVTWINFHCKYWNILYTCSNKNTLAILKTCFFQNYRAYFNQTWRKPFLGVKQNVSLFKRKVTPLSRGKTAT